jgi:hypothetical protein
MLKFECVRAGASAAHWNGDTATSIAYERQLRRHVTWNRHRRSEKGNGLANITLDN